MLPFDLPSSGQHEPQHSVWEPPFRFVNYTPTSMLRLEEDAFMCAVQLEDTENLPITQRIVKIIY